MSHAEVLALLESGVLVSGRLRLLATADTPEALALRAHLAECEECRRELDAWRAVDEALVVATPEDLRAPAAARSRILGVVLATGVARGPDRVLGTAGAALSAPTTAAPTTAAPNPAPTTAAPTTPTQAPVAPPAAGHAASTPAEPPSAGRVWRTPAGASLPSPMPRPATDAAQPAAHLPEAVPGPDALPLPAAPGPAPAAPAVGRRGLRVLPGGQDQGVGFRVFLAVAAAAVFLFALGAALGGPLGLSTPTTVTVPDTTAVVELEKSMGRLSDLLGDPGTTVAPLTDAAGDSAGAVLLGSADTDLLGVVTRALPPPADQRRYVCILEREGERFTIGYMRFTADPAVDGQVAYWFGRLDEDVPADAGAPGDRFLVFLEGDTGGEPLLITTF